HSIRLPVEVIVGKNIIEDIGRIISNHLEGDEVTVLTGPNIRSLYSNTIITSLLNYGYKPRIDTVYSPRISEVERLLTQTPLSTAAVIGLGGGKVLDVGKVLAYKLSKPFVSVPTSASHDGIASPQASLEGLNGSHSIRVATPFIVVADSHVIASAPKQLTLGGIGDVLAKFSSVLDSRLAQSLGEYIGDYSISLAEMSAKLVFSNLEQIVSLSDNGVRTLLEALISNGIAMAIAGSSRPCSGSEHMFGHALDLLTSKKILHGYTVLLGTKISLALHGEDWVNFSERASQAGLPMNAHQIGVPGIYIIRALTFANKIRPDRLTILGNGITLEKAKKVIDEVKLI
ncbi:MAG: iron-containing alcohol dehydrogenase, partial [Thermoprotei archaeon]